MSVLDAYIVGLVIQRFREQRGQSQELLSGLAGIGRTHLSAIERGQRKPTLETFWRISEALGLKPSVLMAAIEEEMQKN
jgi:transcriptional regulator with XRE-family HTH domain